jgi:hypothetical protein
VRVAVGFLANKGFLYFIIDEATRSPRREEKAQHTNETPTLQRNAAWHHD